jgi:hypothetical protein
VITVVIAPLRSSLSLETTTPETPLFRALGDGFALGALIALA